jgi:hypothetical protein
MQERAPRQPGQLLYASDNIQLIATATKLNRTLPDFSGSTKITIRYLLELDAPRYLDCVEKGDKVIFSWVVRIISLFRQWRITYSAKLRNISSKPYGIGSILRRAAGTSLTDPGQVFDFTDPTDNNKHKVVDFLDVLDAGSEVPISQTFTVSQLTLPYNDGNLKLELYFQNLAARRLCSVKLVQSMGNIAISGLWCPMPLHCKLQGRMPATRSPRFYWR